MGRYTIIMCPDCGQVISEGYPGDSMIDTPCGCQRNPTYDELREENDRLEAENDRLKAERDDHLQELERVAADKLRKLICDARLRTLNRRLRKALKGMALDRLYQAHGMDDAVAELKEEVGKNERLRAERDKWERNFHALSEEIDLVRAEMAKATSEEDHGDYVATETMAKRVVKDRDMLKARLSALVEGVDEQSENIYIDVYLWADKETQEKLRVPLFAIRDLLLGGKP